LLRYAADRLRRQPTQLQVLDLDANLVGDFLTFLETNRSNGARSRNTRLSAIHSFFKYVAGNEPQLLHHCQQVLAMPSKRHEKRTIDFLTRAEIEALIEAADKTTRSGRRDRMLLMLALQTGLRVSELINLTRGDVVLGTGAHVRCMGKGRKERATPLRKDCVEALRRWLSERRGADSEPLFINNRGAAQPRCGRTHRSQARRAGGADMPDPDGQAGNAPRVASQRCHAAAPKRCGPHRDRALAGP
jgi:integrase/recombinase XerD